METITMLIVALAPALGTLLAIITIASRICKRFSDLLVMIKDESVVKEIKADNRRIRSLYNETIKDFEELKTEFQTLAQVNQELLTEIRSRELEDKEV